MLQIFRILHRLPHESAVPWIQRTDIGSDFDIAASFVFVPVYGITESAAHAVQTRIHGIAVEIFHFCEIVGTFGISAVEIGNHVAVLVQRIMRAFNAVQSEFRTFGTDQVFQQIQRFIHVFRAFRNRIAAVISAPVGIASFALDAQRFSG